MDVIGSKDALAMLNRQLQHPITKQLFRQSIAPKLIEAGAAQKIGGTLVIDSGAWQDWIKYIVERERKITAGEWPIVRPYSIEDQRQVIAERLSASA